MTDSTATEAPSPTVPAGRTRRLKLAVLAMALASVIGCLLAEVALRILGIGVPLLYEPDPFCGSRLRPYASGVWNHEGNGYVAVNSLGFRGPEVSVPKPVDVFRIAVLGDSFIEGLQVNHEATLCGQLESRLQSTAGNSATYEVINCGVSGYGTAQQLQMLRHYVGPLDVDAVVLAIYPENDIRNNLRSLEMDDSRPYFLLENDGELVLDESFRQSLGYVTADSGYERRKSSIINSSRLLQLLHSFRGGAFPHASSATIGDRLKLSVTEALYTYSGQAAGSEKLAWQTTERLLQEIAVECQKRDLPLFVFSVSSPAQVYPDDSVRNAVCDACSIEDLFYSERRLQKLFSSNGIRFLPIATKLQSVADETGRFLHGFENVQMGRGHWNEFGNRTVAEELADWLLIQDEFLKVE